MSVQPPQTLNDACEFIVDCLHATAPTEADGYPLIRTPNIGKGRLDFTDVYRVSEDTYQTWTTRAVPEPGDLILAREAPAGNVAIVKEGENVCLGQRTVHLRPNRAKVDPDFLCYFLLAPPQQGKLLASETGATAQHVNMKDIRRLELAGLPSLSTQRAAGSLLATYDDLIENNRRRMALLEQAARQLYREWFVRLRFPGHEHTRITDGVPEGWERTSLGAVADNFDRLRVPLSVFERESRPGSYPYHGAAGILDHIDGFIFDGRFLLVGEDGTVQTPGGTPMLQFVDGKLWVSNHAHVLRGSIVSTEFLYCLLSFYQISGHVTGVAQPKLTQANLNRIPVVAPIRLLRDGFQDVVATIFSQRFVLQAQNEKLRAARDLLLPRLMSGEIAV